jgi:hypothetical protein
MNAPKGFQIAEDYASYRPAGEVTLPKAIELLGKAVTFASGKRIGKLLVDTTRLTGFKPPTMADRFDMGTQLAQVPGALRVKVAVVARAELIHPEKFGVTVATNRGMRVNVFASEAEALQWLLDEKDD